jgi:hypothetical protein
MPSVSRKRVSNTFYLFTALYPANRSAYSFPARLAPQVANIICRTFCTTQFSANPLESIRSMR